MLEVGGLDDCGLACNSGYGILGSSPDDGAFALVLAFGVVLHEGVAVAGHQGTGKLSKVFRLTLGSFSGRSPF